MTTKYRGAHCAPEPPPENIAAVFNAGANIIRYALWTDRTNANSMNAEQWTTWAWQRIVYLRDTILPILEPEDKVVINLGVPPGGFIDNKAAMFNPVVCPWGRECLFDFWEAVAREFQGNEKILTYGILNEPGGNAEQVRGLMKQCVKRIRTVDAQKRIAVTCPYSDPAKFDQTVVLQDENIWYEVHMYLPFSISHQGIAGRPYPKPYPTARVDKDKLKIFLSKVRAFQFGNHRRIYVGEFSISDFASTESRKKYLEDCISIFEEHGWNWTYHAWREASVWDVEPNPVLFQMMKDEWGKNG